MPTFTCRSAQPPRQLRDRAGRAAANRIRGASLRTSTPKQIQNIPNPGNDITYIAQTAPGVTMNNSTGGGYGNFEAFGLPGTANLFTINGNDYKTPSSI